ncbi:hypothetical protein SLA2020_337770 [Shorea laevis]
MKVPLCKRPSFAWRSICSARDLLQEGLLWRIGDGKSVNIWKDKWLPIPRTYSVQSPRRLLAAEASVGELIDPDTKWWNAPLIKEIFSETEAEIICNIPLADICKKMSKFGEVPLLGNSQFAVRTIWPKKCKSNKKESVLKSGLQQNMEETLEFASIKSGQDVLVASLQQYPPYQGQPKKEGILTDSSCIFCQMESETSLHVLWNCPAARDVWGSCDKRMQKSTSGGDLS